MALPRAILGLVFAEFAGVGVVLGSMNKGHENVWPPADLAKLSADHGAPPAKLPADGGGDWGHRFPKGLQELLGGCPHKERIPPCGPYRCLWQ